MKLKTTLINLSFINLTLVFTAQRLVGLSNYVTPAGKHLSVITNKKKFEVLYFHDLATDIL